MRARVFALPQKHIVVDDFFDPEEQARALDEIRSLARHARAGAVLRDGAAVDNRALKRNCNVWLDDVWAGKRHRSTILRLFDERFRSAEIRRAMRRTGDLLFEYATYANADCTLLSAYDVGDYYGDHHDEYPSIAANLMLCSSPKRFSGGDLYLGDDHAFDGARRTVRFGRIAFRSGRLVVFPCRARHRVGVVEATTATLPFADRRFSVQHWPMYAPASGTERGPAGARR